MFKEKDIFLSTKLYMYIIQVYYTFPHTNFTLKKFSNLIINKKKLKIKERKGIACFIRSKGFEPL